MVLVVAVGAGWATGLEGGAVVDPDVADAAGDVDAFADVAAWFAKIYRQQLSKALQPDAG